MTRSDLEKTATAKSSQGKGAAFELQVCKKIVNYFNELGVKDLVFIYGEDLHRTEGSGNTVYEKGDITIPNPLLAVLFPFIIECKVVEGWSLEQVVRYDNEENREEEIGGWFFVEAWKKCKKQASRGRIPIVIFTRKRAEIYVLFNLEEVLGRWNWVEGIKRFIMNFYTGEEYGSFGIMTLDGFLAAVAPYTQVYNTRLRFQKLQEH